MSKTIKKQYLTKKINKIKVDKSIKCNKSNFNAMSKRNISYIVVHYTGNKKDNAKNNSIYFSGDNCNASAHFFVDDKNIYQSVKLRDIAWHCGTKGKYYHSVCRNSNSIGIEMCTSGNYRVSDKTKTNSAYLCAELCKMIGISAKDIDKYILRHYDITHKNCPAQMVKYDDEWKKFKQKVKNILEPKKETKKEAKKENKKDLNLVAKEVYKGNYGNGQERTKKLKAEGYTSDEIKKIQNLVNELCE